MKLLLIVPRDGLHVARCVLRQSASCACKYISVCVCRCVQSIPARTVMCSVCFPLHFLDFSVVTFCKFSERRSFSTKSNSRGAVPTTPVFFSFQYFGGCGRWHSLQWRQLLTFGSTASMYPAVQLAWNPAPLVNTRMCGLLYSLSGFSALVRLEEELISRPVESAAA